MRWQNNGEGQYDITGLYWSERSYIDTCNLCDCFALDRGKEAPMKTYYKPPSVDLKQGPGLKECPSCGCKDVTLDRIHRSIACSNSDCITLGPKRDPAGTKWNSIPRKSEIRELLRLLQCCEYTKVGYTQLFLQRFHKLSTYADKMRKEWGV